MANDHLLVEALRSEVAALREDNATLRRELAQAERGSTPDDAEFLRGLLNALPPFVSRLAPDLSMRFLNRLAPGFTPEDTFGRPVFDFIDPAHHEIARQALLKAGTEGTVERYTVSAMGAHQKPSYYETIVAPIQEQDGQVGFVLVAFDITEQVERANTLAAKEAQLRLAVEATGIGLWSVALDGSGTIEWSPRMHEIMGRTRAIGDEDFLDAVHPDDREMARASRARVLEGDNAAWMRHRIVQPNGEVRWVVPTGKILRDADGQPTRMLGGLLDVTTIHDLEERLRLAERMEALGTLTSGVAHNLNNLLAVIRPSLELAAPHATGEGRELLDDAIKASERASKVVRQLMAFAGRPHVSRTRVFSVSGLVKEALALTRRSLPDEISLGVTADAPHLLVECNPDELSEVVHNLVLNARDALLTSSTTKPTIDVSITSEACAPPPTNEAEPPTRVLISVTDNGPGIEEHIQKRVFDPFFTTKGPASGTGLGLAISWSVVRSMGGSLDCRSTPGQGATFELRLPVSLAQSTPRDSDAARPPGSHTPLRVLLVDDNEFVRRVTRRALDRGQHHVTEASTLGDALRKARAEHFDVVLLDQWLPDGCGTNVIPELRSLSPSQKIVLFTGQDIDPATIRGADAVLSKPMGVNELLRTLAELAKS